MLTLDKMKKGKPLYKQTFFTAFCIAAAFFIPYILMGNGYFLFYGDFNVQQVPFYQLCHRAVREGNFGWNWYTDLGANFIGSYSFYLLGSPFFWLTVPFPNSFVPYLMGPLLILKFALAALTAYCYISRFVKHNESAMLGGLLYAFCGFSVYNIFFNHFHEAIIVFPLLLLAMEKHIADGKRGYFAAAVFLAAVTNYFFFFGMVVFCVIYWLLRIITRSVKQSLRSFLAMLTEAVLGVACSAFILLPTVLCVMQNSRVSSFNWGYDSWLYGRVQIYANILEVLFFPPDIPARPVFFPGADVKWSSLGAWLPLMGIVGGVAYGKTHKKSWITKLLSISLFMSLVPVLNAAFYMFNSAYYARWFFMPLLILCLSSVMAIEDDRVDFKPAFKWVFAVTAVITLIVGLWPDGQNDDGSITRFGIYTFEADSFTYIGRYWATCLIALGSLVTLGVLLKKYRKYHKMFLRSAISAVAVISVIYSAFFIGCGKCHSYDIKNEVIPDLIEGSLQLDGDPDTFRIDCYECMDNTAMFLGYSGINAFHSIVPKSVTDFYEYIGEERSVGSRPTTESYAIRSLLSVKYLINRTDGDKFTDEYDETRMPEWTYQKTEDGFDVYSNNCYIPYGFTYDKYVSYKNCDALSSAQRANMMVKALLLTNEQIEKYGNLLTETDGSDYMLNSDELKKDAADRAATAAYSFCHDNSDFKAKINLKSKNLVFFSVPYEQGWTAYVNGKEVDIEKVNVGFMAVLCDEGDNEIVFKYKTPGLTEGLLISLAAVLILAAYLFVCFKNSKQKPFKYNGEWPEGEALSEYLENQEEPLYVKPTFEDGNEPQDGQQENDDSSGGFTVDEDDGETVIDSEALHKFLEEGKDDENT